VAADSRDHPADFGAAMQRRKLANRIIVADFKARRFAAELQVGRRSADRGVGKNPVALPDNRVPFDNAVGTD
jgi:hypothetical protein